MKLPYRVLVIDDDENALCGMEELLRAAGHDVTTTTSYEDAKKLLSLGGYDLLVTDVRIRSFNGLHLVMKVRNESPGLGVVIMSGYDSSLMELEARRYNATFVRKPIKPEEFIDVVSRGLKSVRRERRWPRKAVAGGFRVMAAGQPAAVVDVCYDGLRLEMPPAGSLPAMFVVEVSGIGLNLDVEPVWAFTAADGSAVICGATLASDSTPAVRVWRDLVDRLIP
ncbi:MAG TPA: response regulator [Vicinamibacterales bacterium]|nr:response regulator [Vicinamibacterales bacterium]